MESDRRDLAIHRNGVAFLIMSAIFIINFSKNEISFDHMNNLAKQIVKIALKENVGVFFNSFDYAENLISDAKMENFVLLSDSFLYKNCDFLDTSSLRFKDKKFKHNFHKKYGFINKILKAIKNSGMTTIDIYISNDGSIENVADFETKKTSVSSFLDDLISSIFEFSAEYAYGFPTIKYTLDLQL